MENIEGDPGKPSALNEKGDSVLFQSVAITLPISGRKVLREVVRSGWKYDKKEQVGKTLSVLQFIKCLLCANTDYVPYVHTHTEISKQHPQSSFHYSHRAVAEIYAKRG